MLNSGNADGGNKPEKSMSLSPNIEISSSDGINSSWPPPAPVSLVGSTSGPGEEVVPAEYSRGKRVDTRLNGVLACAKEIWSLANSDVSCDGDSMYVVERGTGRFFLRAGRIHGGRTGFGMDLSEEVALSSGICVTTNTIRCSEIVTKVEHTPAKLFHHIA